MGGLAQNVQKPPPGKNVQKSQGQIFQEFVEFQECQGQISQGQMGNRKKLEKWEMEKWESVTKIKNQKHLKRY